MSDSKVDALLARIAALETKLAGQSAAPQQPAFDSQAFARAFAANPIGVMSQMGIPVDHVSRVLVAHTLGDAAPPELRMLAQQGPLVSATQALTADVQAMRQRLDGYEQRDQAAARRQSFSALAADKSKYPRLAAVLSKNPELLMGEVDSYKGDTASLAADIEQRLSALAPALGAPQLASQANAENEGQSTQAKQAQPGATGLDPTPPPIPQATQGLFTPDKDRELKERILRKHSPAELETRGQ